jgi:competence protein ComEA
MRYQHRLTPVERRALALIALAWGFGVVAEWAEWPSSLVDFVERRLDPPLASIEAVAAQLGPDDWLTQLYVAALELRAERKLADAPPEPINPNLADRVAWDRLPGIGPKTAAAILEHRTRHGGFDDADDLLAVPGIGPKTLDRLRPYLEWPMEDVRPGAADGQRQPDLNRVDAAFLEALPGIGPKLAKSIVRERIRQRGFRSWGEVLAIQGIGPAKLGILQRTTRLAISSRARASDPEGKR